MRLAALHVLACFLASAESPSNWPQFRGPNGSGVATTPATPPTRFAGGSKLLWKTPLPSGHSSPAIWGDRIFLTAFDKEPQKLETLALHRRTGKILWRQAAPATGIEKVHDISSPATATPALDGERVYVYFGSAGLLAYDFEGNQVWHVPMPVASAAFGSGTSPILHGEAVILSHDEGKEPYLLAVNRKTGTILWKQPQWQGKYPMAFSHSTPAIRDSEIILHRHSEVVAFDVQTGARRWWHKTMTQGNSTPIVGPDAIYVSTWMNMGEPDLVVPLPSFDSIVARYDKDGDGAFNLEEFPTDIPFTRRIDLDGVKGAAMTIGKWGHGGSDSDKDGKVTAAEWDGYAKGFGAKRRDHGILALKPVGEGELGPSVVSWAETRGVPEIPTPLLYNGKIYAVTNGGIVSVMDAKTGTLAYRARVGAPGGYYASPVAAAGQVYLASGEGVVSVLRDGHTLDLLARNELGEPIFATPAIVDGKLYVRTTSHLYAFGE